MKILIIGLEGITTESLFGDERLINLRRLAESGCYGPLCEFQPADQRLAWEQLAGQFKSAVVLEGAPERKIVVHPAELRTQLDAILGAWPNVSDSLVTDEMEEATQSVLALSRSQFATAKKLLQHDAVEFVEFNATGMECLQQLGAATASDFGPHLDAEIAGLLESLDDNAIVLVVSATSGNDVVSEGAFILNASGAMNGETDAVAHADLAATIVALTGHEVPTAISGRTLLAEAASATDAGDISDEAERLIRERLSGLGYL